MLDTIDRKDIAILEEGSIDLLIESYSNATRILQIRGMTKDAQILHDHTTNSDRSLATSSVGVSSIPVSLTIRTATTGVSRGACYVKVSLRVEGIVVATLISAYVTSAKSLAWPNGQIESSVEGPGLIRSIIGTNPAAGVEILETVPTGARWKILSFIATLTCSSDAANRIPVLIIKDPTNTYYSNDAISASIANTAFNFAFGQGVNRYAGSNNIKNWDWPIDFFLLAGHTIGTTTSALQAADNWTAPQYLVEEWIEP